MDMFISDVTDDIRINLRGGDNRLLLWGETIDVMGVTLQHGN